MAEGSGEGSGTSNVPEPAQLEVQSSCGSASPLSTEGGNSARISVLEERVDNLEKIMAQFHMRLKNLNV